MSETPEWLTVRQTADRLAVSEETVRRMIRNFELPASRKHSGARAPWMVNATALERQLAADAERVAIRQRLAGSGGGYGPTGREAAVDAVARHNEWTEEQRLAERERRREIDEAAHRRELFARVQREVFTDRDFTRQFEALDEDQIVERAAAEIARRVRRQERALQQAAKLLDDDGERPCALLVAIDVEIAGVERAFAEARTPDDRRHAERHRRALALVCKVSASASSAAPRSCASASGTSS